MHVIDYFQDTRAKIHSIEQLKPIVFKNILVFWRSNKYIIVNIKVDLFPIIFTQNELEVFCAIVYVSILNDI